MSVFLCNSDEEKGTLKENLLQAQLMNRFILTLCIYKCILEVSWSNVQTSQTEVNIFLKVKMHFQLASYYLFNQDSIS